MESKSARESNVKVDQQGKQKVSKTPPKRKANFKCADTNVTIAQKRILTRSVQNSKLTIKRQVNLKDCEIQLNNRKTEIPWDTNKTIGHQGKLK